MGVDQPKSNYLDKEKEFINDVQKIIDKYEDHYIEGFFSEEADDLFNRLSFHFIKLKNNAR